MKFNIEELNKLDPENRAGIEKVRRVQENGTKEEFIEAIENYFGPLLKSNMYTDEIVVIGLCYLLQDSKNDILEVKKSETPSFSRLLGVYKEDVEPILKIVDKEQREKKQAEAKRKAEEEKNIVKDEAGVTAIEFAMVVPILFLLLLGILEYNLVMYSESVLQGAITTAARAGKTGYVNTTSTGVCPSPVVGSTVVPQTQASYINCIVKNNVGGLLNPNNVELTYVDMGGNTYSSPTYAANCTNNPSLVNSNTPLCAETTQAAGDIVVYTATYNWPIITPFMQNFLGKNGYFTLKASAVVKNEPYGAN